MVCDFKYPMDLAQYIYIYITKHDGARGYATFAIPWIWLSI